MSEANTLEIRHLRTVFHTRKGDLAAVNDVSLTVPKGKIVGIVGESGCGKSMTAMSVMQLVRKPGEIESGQILFRGEDLLQKTPGEMQKIRGDRISMIFQEPMTSLNPVYTVGHQVEEALRIHEHLSKEELHRRAVEIFEAVGIPEAEERLKSYPHQLSGGLRQRVMIGMAMICKPDLLIADEPTTALDVTIEAQILALMKKLRDENGTSILLITHNMGVVAKMCDFVYVMYAGRVMEQAEVFELFRNVQHPYTAGLLQSIPRIDHVVDRLYTIPGVVPNLLHLPAGCGFCTRCRYAQDRCYEELPELREIAPGHFIRCFSTNQELSGKEESHA
ncbi:MAG: ABC transporter ATP-binding protein [Lachnospiraceae bacterium]|jgi:oligopeptide/dipeptide ABC transporter ATP-binding protein|nr:ABC transporter ATP-binding protein [Lachnospiraceae bacterium]MCI1397819.1 ABC transporter ATP-binding protein [Lachnospiraceae bacterium]MCI1424711.1 ABC transporter ATP-binding protein [Lachnospiraceae bacterium]MCI1453164.1 ABC transporter ATP-binding protein [Lachnospiraceae bacterium]